MVGLVFTYLLISGISSISSFTFPSTTRLDNFELFKGVEIVWRVCSEWNDQSSLPCTWILSVLQLLLDV